MLLVPRRQTLLNLLPGAAALLPGGLRTEQTLQTKIFQTPLLPSLGEITFFCVVLNLLVGPVQNDK